tara:strand:- start:1002 stop:1148 length:147 start_codon:yes stop_codon:yes gene_type:complete
MASTASRISPPEGPPSVAHPDEMATMIQVVMLLEALKSFFIRRLITFV